MAGTSLRLVDPIPQLLARLEVRHELAVEAYRLPGLGVATDARGAVVQGKAAEATDLDPVPGRQGLGHLLQHGLDCQLDILRGQLPLMGNDPFDQLRLGHGFPFFFKRLDQLRSLLAC